MISRKVEELNPWEFFEAMDQEDNGKVLVVDVREMDEYIGDLGHIRGSMNIPLGELPKHLEMLRNRGRIAFVCNTGDRSYFACRYLMDNGINQVLHLKGGLVQWHLSGLDVDYE